MKNILRNPVVIVGVLAYLFLICMQTVLPLHWLFDVINAMAVFVGFAIILSYTLGIAGSFAERRWSAPQYLVLGIWWAWINSTGRILFNWYGRVTGTYLELFYHPIAAWLTFGLMLGGVLHLTARGAIDGEIPKRNWIYLGMSIAAAMTAATLLILFVEPIEFPYRPPKNLIP